MSKLEPPHQMYASSDKGCSRIIVITRSQIVFEIIISYFLKIDKSAKYDRFFFITLKLAELGVFLKHIFSDRFVKINIC